MFVGSVLSPEPGGPPALYIKGSADDLIHSLVAHEKIDIKIVDNQPFSFDELEERKIQVHHALEAKGFKDVVTGFSVTGEGQITAAVTQQTGLPADATEILSTLPASLRASVTLTVSKDPIAVDDSGFGGMWMQVSGANDCTSGWSVWNTSGVTGVTTAGHCFGLNQINDPVAGVSTLTFQARHRGQWGDVEWYTSPQLEPAQFYANANTIRYVTSIEPRASISQGATVCVYGRASNSRDCSLQVQNVSVSCTVDGVSNDRLVE